MCCLLLFVANKSTSVPFFVRMNELKRPRQKEITTIAQEKAVVARGEGEDEPIPLRS